MPSSSSSPGQSAEDYLERIQDLIQTKGCARAVDIASSLRVRRASVTSLVQKLGALGYLNYEKYRVLVLTQKGRAVAARIKKRHQTLSRFFSLFGLDQAAQRNDIEGIEHHLSAQTVDVLASLAAYFERHPSHLRAFLNFRAARKALKPHPRGKPLSIPFPAAAAGAGPSPRSSPPPGSLSQD